MMHPDAAAANTRDGWPGILAYFNALPPLERTVRGLVYDTDDPEIFRWQTGAIYTATSLLLTGFEGVEVD
jgi:hypothetical protein